MLGLQISGILNINIKIKTIIMENQNFSRSFTVNESPANVFNAINNVRGWWSEEIDGSTEKLNDEFNYHFEDIHRCSLKIIESVPGKKVVWHVKENYFKPGIFEGASAENANMFANDKAEWTDTEISFEITEEKGKTQINFVHFGLVPAYECYDVCSSGWSHYMGQSLYNLITTGTGLPNKTGSPMTEVEEKIRIAN
jgi:hypothetical protein